MPAKDDQNNLDKLDQWIRRNLDSDTGMIAVSAIELTKRVESLLAHQKKQAEVETRKDEITALREWFEENYKNGAGLGDDCYVTEHQLERYIKARKAKP